MKLKKIVGAVLLATAPVAAFATNGMNMEGFGPVATAMGGASMAYDNGPAAMMNNPATLGLMAEGSGVGVAMGWLGPDVTAGVPAMGIKSKSGGDSYYMPAAGFLHKSGNLTYGVGVYSQGGMGTEYTNSSFVAADTGVAPRSEVGVGRLIFPLAYNVNDRFVVGGSIDWVWATMDMTMAAAAATDFMAMYKSGNYMPSVAPTAGGYYAMTFSDSNDFSGAAKGSGFAGKIGFVYKIRDDLSIGATYHSKTHLGDLETGSSAAKVIGVNGTYDSGKITVRNFQWPETYGFGISYTPSDKLMLAFDYKRINWAGVMDTFNMTYSDSVTGTSANFGILQKWKNQDVFMLGASYKLNDSWTLRAGANLSDNPVPDAYVNPLFPAIVKNHYMLGFGYMINKNSGIDFSATYAPRVTATGTSVAGAPGSGVVGNNGVQVTNAETCWQFQYGYKW